MNILYGVQTTGHGHLIRSRAMIRELKKRGHTVFTVLSGPDLKAEWDVSMFEPYQFFKGLTFITKRGKIELFETAQQLDFIQFYKDILNYENVDKIDLVITDYEPITARLAKMHKIPSIGIGHMYAFAHKVPIASFNPFAILIVKRFAPVQFPIGLHWFHYNQPILPPTIPPEVGQCDDCQVDPKKILVYLSFESLDEVKDYLKPFNSYNFYIYSKVPSPIDEGHIHIRPFSREGFLKDLRESSGAIANAGFSMASEALHLGKKLLLKPIKGQTEQESNALALHRLKLGSVMKNLNPKALEKWLDFPSILPMNYSYLINDVIDWIESGNWDKTKDLVAKAWESSKKALAQTGSFKSRDFSGKYKKYRIKYPRPKTPTKK
ncbi:MAG: glycosyltransferase family protein [Spirochaetia bacterium]